METAFEYSVATLQYEEEAVRKWVRGMGVLMEIAQAEI